MRKKKIFIIDTSLVLLLIVYLVSHLNESIGEKEKVFTAFFASYGNAISKNNRIQDEITERIGAKAEVEWLDEETAKEHVRRLIASGEYPDFIDASDAYVDLLEAKALVPLEDYIEDYPNIEAYLSDEEWNQLMDEEGHIFIIPQFGIVNVKETDTSFRDEAFWIQKCVLEWAGYPTITTLDEYFDVIERYRRTNSIFDGENIIGFRILCDGWRGFCLENPPQFLAGYSNDGCAIVDKQTQTAFLYDFIPEAKYYFQTLNRAYNKGLIPADTFVLSYEEYLQSIMTGRVLGMVDQYLQFELAQKDLYSKGMERQTYVPLALTIDANKKEHYHSVEALDVSNGIGITVSCDDVEGALQFLNDLLDPEIMKLRYWGELGIDYEVTEDGLFYRTEQQRDHAADREYVRKNFCNYNSFLHYDGMLADGINTVLPTDQPSEYYDTLCEYDQNFLKTYGFRTFMKFIDLPEETNAAWFPLYTYTNQLDNGSVMGRQKERMMQLKMEWLPQVIMCKEEIFEQMWQEYQEQFYSNINVEMYERLLTAEVRRRVAEKDYKLE